MRILTPNLMCKSNLAFAVGYQRSLLLGGSVALRQNLGVSDGIDDDGLDPFMVQVRL